MNLQHAKTQSPFSTARSPPRRRNHRSTDPIVSAPITTKTDASATSWPPLSARCSLGCAHSSQSAASAEPIAAPTQICAGVCRPERTRVHGAVSGEAEHDGGGAHARRRAGRQQRERRRRGGEQHEVRREEEERHRVARRHARVALLRAGRPRLVDEPLEDFGEDRVDHGARDAQHRRRGVARTSTPNAVPAEDARRQVSIRVRHGHRSARGAASARIAQRWEQRARERRAVRGRAAAHAISSAR